MKIDHYLYVIEIADTGSFAQAARNLFVSQPNLSYIVKQMEQQLGYPIFVRTGSGVYPTKEGAALIERFRFLKRECDMIDELFYNRETLPLLSFKVLTLNMISAASSFTKICSDYCGSRIDFSLDDYTTLSDVLDRLKDADLAVIGMITPYVKNLQAMLRAKAIEYHPVIDLPIYAWVGKQNPLWEKEGDVTIEELSQYPILQFSDNTDNPQQSIVHAMGIKTNINGRIQVNSGQAFYQIIQETPVVGINAVSPDKFLHVTGMEDVRLLKISDCNLTWQIAWIKQRRVPLSDVAVSFIESLKELY